MKKQKQVKGHLKAWLLMGKSITSNQALKMWRTSRLAVYINRLRNEGMKIVTEMVTSRGDQYAKYFIPKTRK